jgi:transcriptional regulator with XRE-family HTH domain
MGFGNFVREERHKKGLGLNEFARRLGVSPAYWSRVEREVEKPPQDALIQRTAELLDVPRDEIFIEAERFPPEMKQDVARAIRAYRRIEREDER